MSRVIITCYSPQTNIEDKLIVYNKELEDMSKISMSANESRQKKELLLKVEVLKKEQVSFLLRKVIYIDIF